MPAGGIPAPRNSQMIYTDFDLTYSTSAISSPSEADT
jgi:hypothetical protein